MSQVARTMPGSPRRAQLARRSLTGTEQHSTAGAQGGRQALCLRHNSSTLSDGSITVDNQTPSKLVVKPDGNILWEMPTEPSNPSSVGPLLRGVSEMALVLSAASSGIMGIAVAIVELKRASENNYCLTSQHLAKIMAMTVSSSFAGTIAGLLYAPLLATRMLCGRFARPAAIVGTLWAATRGVLRVLSLRGLAPARLLRQLEEAALSLGSGCITAAEAVAERGAASGRFRRAFVRMGGVDTLLRLLRNGLDGDAVRSIMRALASLLQDDDAQTAFVAQGGVPHLVLGLQHPDADVTVCCSSMLAKLASNPDAQAAIRSSGGVPLVVELLGRSGSASQQLHLLSLITSLAAAGGEASSEVAAAGAVPVILDFVASSPLPRTQVKEAAIHALSSLTTSSSTHFDALRSQPDAAQRLTAVAAAYDGSWYGSKPALAGLQAALAAAEAEAAAAAAAPIAGEAPELVELP